MSSSSREIPADVMELAEELRIDASVYEIARALMEQQARWIPVTERMPEEGRIVLAGFRNSLGNWRTVRAVLVGKFMIEMDDEGAMEGEYNEADGADYVPPGWYEECEAGESVWRIAEDVTHWQPLPPAPTTDE